MSNNRKTAPVGVDIEIDKLQVRLYEKTGFTNIDGYGRVELVPKDKKTVPHYFTKPDYKEVLMDDKLNGIFFFVEKASAKFNDQKIESEIDIYFLLDLVKLYPNVVHRADEEARVDILDQLTRSRWFQNNEITIVKGQDALSEFDHNLTDLQPYHFIKFSGKIKYQFNC